MKKSAPKAKASAAYDHKAIEKKWQKYWESKKTYSVKEDSKKKKFYALIEFPYPSGDGMHVGHIRSNTAMDVISRKRRAQGYNVLYPIGWDAFGLPTENYAIKTGIQPAIVSKKNIDTFRRQLKALGFSFDWSREVDTTDPTYYKWTQWIFLQFFKKGLAYKKKMTINWCPKDLIGLANEEVIDGTCERCGTAVEKREKEQWMLAITKYADRLDKDLDQTEFLEKIKIQQRNWIGKSEGVNFKCTIKDLGIQVEMYNSVPQTYRAETFTVIAPEHELVKKLVVGTTYEKDVTAFVEAIKKKKAENKFDIETDMEGIFTGRYIQNFAGTGRDLPIWVASYVLADYGTGMVNCSAHDLRDYAFAKKYSIPLHPVAEALFVNTQGEDAAQMDKPFVERNAAVCVIKHWSEDKYLCLKWKKNNWKGFVVGGIEADEKTEDAALREICEETGYKNMRIARTLPKIHSKFFQPLKQSNRFAHFHPVYVELTDGEREEMSAEEQAIHDVVWVDKSEVDSFLNKDDMKWIWKSTWGTEGSIVKNGILTEPEQFKGREWSEVRPDIIKYLEDQKFASRKTNYKLRDWIFSRQRYWGEPIPVVHCTACGVVPVPEKDLPVELPPVKNYKPTETGESPLAAITKWVNTKCPQCKGPATRETDTMPNWAGSSWYYLRYTDPKNKKAFADPRNLNYWTPVDWYNGGMEHTTLHLLYSRFWHKFLFDLGLVPTNEPYMKRTSHGMILAAGGVKMSKSLGNVINPDGIVESVGADSLRLYEMFMGPFDQSIAWDTNNIAGVRRFIERVWKLREKVVPKTDEKVGDFVAVNKIIHKAIKKIGDDIEAMRFNTAISTLMITINELEKKQAIDAEQYGILLQLLAPFAPHVTEELWASLGNKKLIHTAEWPAYDSTLAADSEITIIVQINGKMRGSFIAPADMSREELEKRAQTIPEAAKWLEGKKILKIIVIPNRLVNIVVG